MMAPRFYLFVLFAVGLSGCLSLSVDQQMEPGERDWAMEGASYYRQHVSDTLVNPPLYEQWRYDAGAGVGASGALIVNDLVIVGTRKGFVHSMQLKDGKRVGRIKHDAPIEGGMVVGDGRLFIPIAGDKKSVLAYDLASGKRLWTVKGKPVEAGLVYTPEAVIAVDALADVFALDPDTGDELWRTSIAERTTVTSSPILIDQTLFVTAESGVMYALDVASGMPLWEIEIGAPVYNTASTNGRLIFVPTTRGRLIAVDTFNRDVAWVYEIGDATVRFSAPAYDVHQDRLIVSATSGEVRALDAKNGGELWNTRLDGAINSAPLITEQTVYVGTMRKFIYGLDIDTGSELWNHEVTGRVKAAVSGAGNSIVVLAETQQVLAFSTEEPVTEEDQAEETP